MRLPNWNNYYWIQLKLIANSKEIILLPQLHPGFIFAINYIRNNSVALLDRLIEYFENQVVAAAGVVDVASRDEWTNNTCSFINVLLKYKAI